MSHNIHRFMWDVIANQCHNFTEVRAWMSNYIPSLRSTSIFDSCAHTIAGLWKNNNWINTTIFASLWSTSSFVSNITKPIPDNLPSTWLMSPSSHELVFNNTTVVLSKFVHLWNIRPEADLNDIESNGVNHIKMFLTKHLAGVISRDTAHVVGIM